MSKSLFTAPDAFMGNQLAAHKEQFMQHAKRVFTQDEAAYTSIVSITVYSFTASCETHGIVNCQQCGRPPSWP